DFDKVHENDVIHQRAHGEVTHHRRHAQHLWILMVVDGCDLMLLHERDKRMKEVAKHSALGAQRRTIGRETVDNHPFRFKLLHYSLDVVKMLIDLETSVPISLTIV